MKRRSLFTSVPPFALAAAGAFGAGRLSTSAPTAPPPCGSGVDGGDAFQAPGPPQGQGPPEAPATPGPGTAPRLVAPLPTPTEAERAEAERAWQREWLDLVTRPAGKPDS